MPVQPVANKANKNVLSLNMSLMPSLKNKSQSLKKPKRTERKIRTNPYQKKREDNISKER